jgi:hypothetical protein
MLTDCLLHLRADCVLQSGPAVSSEGINLGPIKEGSSADSFLLPEDLVHLTRRSLFLIIDSDNSTAFHKLQVRRDPTSQ